MFPAFNDWKAAARFSALLLLLLLLPAILKTLGLPPREAVYNGIHEKAGPFIFTRHQLFESSEDIDIAFVGSSVMKMAVDADYIQHRMVERFGQDVSVRMFGFVFQGFELQYTMIRDLVERRRVKMLVTTFSGEHYVSDRPHVQLHRFLRYGDYPDVFTKSPQPVALYASYVLGAPRQLLTFLREDTPTSLGSDRRSLMSFEGRTNPPGDPAPPVVLSDESVNDFVLSDTTLSERQRYFTRAIADLLAKHEVPWVVMNIPLPEDLPTAKIWERADWRRILPSPPVVVGFRHAELFSPGVPPSRFYADEVHLNADGQSCMTRSLTPFLLDQYASVTRRD